MEVVALVGEIASDSSLSDEAASALVGGEEEYASLSFESLAADAPGSGPAHDEVVADVCAGMSSWEGAVERDAEALSAIGRAFDQEDQALAQAILGG